MRPFFAFVALALAATSAAGTTVIDEDPAALARRSAWVVVARVVGQRVWAEGPASARHVFTETELAMSQVVLGPGKVDRLRLVQPGGTPVIDGALRHHVRRGSVKFLVSDP